MRNRLLFILMVAALFVYTGCEVIDPDMAVQEETDGELGKVKEVKKSNDDELEKIVMQHEISLGEKTVPLQCEYSIQKNRVNNWKFTWSSEINLLINTSYEESDFEFYLNNLYSDVSVLSKYEKYNGVRQDSLNLNYSSLDNGGIRFDHNYDFRQPFQVEGINQNSTSVLVVNGYGSSTTDRITEKQINEHAEGAKLTTVWTIFVKDTQTGNIYSKIVSDKISLPVKKESTE